MIKEKQELVTLEGQHFFNQLIFYLLTYMFLCFYLPGNYRNEDNNIVLFPCCFQGNIMKSYYSG